MGFYQFQFLHNLLNGLATKPIHDGLGDVGTDPFDLLEIVHASFRQRIQIAKMLAQGFDYLTIRNCVKVTSGTIAHINNLLNTSGEGLKMIVDRLIKLEEARQKKLEGKQPIIPPGPMTLAPDLVELGINITASQLKRRNKRKSIQVESLEMKKI